MTKKVVNKKPHQVRVRDLPVVRGTCESAAMSVLEKNKKGLEARNIPVAEVFELLKKAWMSGWDAYRSTTMLDDAR